MVNVKWFSKLYRVSNLISWDFYTKMLTFAENRKCCLKIKSFKYEQHFSIILKMKVEKYDFKVKNKIFFSLIFRIALNNFKIEVFFIRISSNPWEYLLTFIPLQIKLSVVQRISTVWVIQISITVFSFK